MIQLVPKRIGPGACKKLEKEAMNIRMGGLAPGMVQGCGREECPKEFILCEQPAG